VTRPRLLLLLTLLVVPGVATAQRVRVQLGVTPSQPLDGTGIRKPTVRTPNILRDPRWREAIQSSFPLRMRFRIEIWRVRTDWFDALERSFEWEVVIQYEPLTDEYSKTLIFGGSPRGINRFLSIQELERNLESPNEVNIVPSGVGEYYFAGTLQIRTLTDEEMEELERFLQGEPTGERRDPAGPSLGRSARRLLLRFGGLPFQELEARSARFVVTLP